MIRFIFSCPKKYHWFEMFSWKYILYYFLFNSEM